MGARDLPLGPSERAPLAAGAPRRRAAPDRRGPRLVLLFLCLAASAACDDGHRKRADAGPEETGVGDAGALDAGPADGGEGPDAQVADLTPPETSITAPPPSLGNSPSAHFEFASSEANSTFQCALDQGAAQPCTSPFDLTVSEGVHTLAVAASDASGNADPTPATASWTVDLTPPETAITRSPPVFDNSSDVELEFNSEANATFECRKDGAAWAACASPAAMTGLSDGAHTFEVRALDAAGNVDLTPASTAWTTDTSTPDTEIDSGPQGAVSDLSATFEFHSPNAGANATFRCSLDSAAPATCTSPVHYEALSEAAHQFTVQVTNAAGTSDPTPATRAWVVDRTPPTVAFTGGPSGPTRVAAPTFPFTVGGSPVAVECQVDSGAYAACASPFAPASLSDGAHAVRVRATDAAGNSASDTRSFTVDTQAPTAIIDAPTPANPTASTSATFAFHSPDASAAFTCSLDGAAWAACTSGRSYSALAGGAGTAHSFSVRATDPAGNTGLAATFTWTVDTEAPAVSFTSGPADPTPTNDATPAFSFETSGAPARVECQLDGAAFAACSSPFTAPALGDGQHALVVRATDAAGNSGATPRRSFTVDTQAPTIALDSTPPAYTNLANSAVAFHSPSDAGATFECSTTGAAGPFSACASPQAFSTGANATASRTLSVRAKDAAGNLSTVASYSWTVDTRPPAIDRSPPSGWTVNYFPFAFSGPVAGVVYQCQSSDGAAWSACQSPSTVSHATYGAANVFRVRWLDSAGNASTPASASWSPSPGLVLYYPLNGDTRNYSILEYPRAYETHDGDANVYVEYFGGYAGAAGQLVDGAVSLGGTRAPLTSGVDYTVSLWILPGTLYSSSLTTLWTNRGSGAGCDLSQGVEEGAVVVLSCYDEAGTEVGTVKSWPNSTWSNVLVQFKGTGHGAGGGGDVTLFMNGSSPQVLANPTGVDFFPSSQLESAQIGGSGDGPLPTLDEVRIYNRTYDPQTQCTALLHGRWSTDGSCTPARPGNALHFDAAPLAADAGSWFSSVSLVMGTASVEPGVVGDALHFRPAPAGTSPGTLSVARYASINSQPGHTVALWFMDPSGAGTNTLFRSLSDMGVHVVAAAGTLTVQGRSYPQGAFSRTAPYTVGAWHHLMLVDTVYNNAQLTPVTDELDVYLDGARIMAFPFSGGGQIWTGNLTSFAVGSAGGSPDILIDEYKLWPVNLTSLLNGAGQPEARCTLALGGLFDASSGTCKFP